MKPSDLRLLGSWAGCVWMPCWPWPPNPRPKVSRCAWMPPSGVALSQPRVILLTSGSPGLAGAHAHAHCSWTKVSSSQGLAGGHRDAGARPWTLFGERQNGGRVLHSCVPVSRYANGEGSWGSWVWAPASLPRFLPSALGSSS